MKLHWPDYIAVAAIIAGFWWQIVFLAGGGIGWFIGRGFAVITRK